MENNKNYLDKEYYLIKILPRNVESRIKLTKFPRKMSNPEALKVQTPIAEKTSQLSWHVLRIAIGVLLIGTGLLKAQMLATQPLVGDGIGILNSRWLNVLAVELELAFAMWLFAGLMQRLTYLLSLLCFGIFAIVSASKWYGGAESCHCFGAVTTPPIHTMLLDLTIIGLLIVFRPQGMVFQWTAYRQELLELKRFRWIGFATVIWLVLAVPVTYAMISVEKNDLAELGTEFFGADGKKTILLDPERWVEKPFPLLPFIEPPEVREKLKTGEWTVVLYHNDCPKCQEVIDDLIEKKMENLVCVEVSASNDSTSVNSTAIDISNGYISDINSWLINTPVIIRTTTLSLERVAIVSYVNSHS